MLKNKRLVETANYDALNRVSSRADALGNTTYFTYDAAGNEIEQTDVSGTTKYEYDAMNNQTVMVDAKENTTTTTTYDALGNQLTVTDAEENTTQYEYDKNGNMVSETDSGGIVTRYTYDHAGNRLSEGVGALSLGDFELGEPWNGATINTVKYREGHRSGKLVTPGISNPGAEISMTRDVSLDLSEHEDFKFLA